jgi:hypothetical protein
MAIVILIGRNDATKQSAFHFLLVHLSILLPFLLRLTPTFCLMYSMHYYLQLNLMSFVLLSKSLCHVLSSVPAQVRL